MSDIKNRSELTAELVAQQLVESGFVTQKDKFQLEKHSSNHVILKSQNHPLRIMVVEVEEDKNCLVSLLNSQEPLRSVLCNYSDDLGIASDLEFPLHLSSFLKSIDREKLSRSIKDKLNLQTQPTRTLEKQPSKIKEAYGPLPGSSPNAKKNQPQAQKVELPKFDDEYEINDSESRSQFPGLNLPGDRGHSGYGDPDLYPLGERSPFGSGMVPHIPNSGSGSQSGGMIFDPFRQNHSDQRYKDPSNSRGPGYIPGSKYNDPFGRPNGDFPGSSSSSGGNGGFSFL